MKLMGGFLAPASLGVFTKAVNFWSCELLVGSYAANSRIWGRGLPSLWIASTSRSMNIGLTGTLSFNDMVKINLLC